MHKRKRDVIKLRLETWNEQIENDRYYKEFKLYKFIKYFEKEYIIYSYGSNTISMLKAVR